jgi:hypothetical protein
MQTMPSANRMVISVRPDAADEVQRLIAGRGANAEIVRGPGVVRFRIDLGGVDADEHPWARRLADEVARLGRDVVAISVP